MAVSEGLGLNSWSKHSMLSVIKEHFFNLAVIPAFVSIASTFQYGQCASLLF